MRNVLLFCFLVLGLGTTVQAQTPGLLGDEWIQYQQRYFKIPVSVNGIYRISQSALSGSGIPATVTGNQFRLYRMGQEVPLTVSTPAAFSATDYLEFAATKNDGQADAELYTGPQTNPGRSLFSDTAWYFLTWDAGTTGLRNRNGTATIPTNPASVASRCRATVHKEYGNFFHEGRSNNPLYQFPSSKFEEAEGFLNGKYSPGWSFTDELATPEAVSGDAVFTTGVAGYSLDYYANGQQGIPAPPHPIKIYANGQLLVDTIYGIQQFCRFQRTFTGGPQAATVPLSYQSRVVSAPNYDYWGVSYAEIQYWRSLNYSGQSLAEFELEPSATDQLVVVSNFSATGGAPRLYDRTNSRYYDGDQSVAGQVRFYLQPSAIRRSCLVAASGSIVPATISGEARFTDYAATSASGDFVIITHPSLETGSGAITAYKTYRASAAGGSHQPVVAYTPDLYDQFAGGISQHPLAIKHFLSRLQQSAAVKPRNVLLIGHGVGYPAYRSGSAVAYSRSLVPTYGHPGSDGLFTDGTVNAPAIGRISVLTPSELTGYLNKIKSYESALQPANPTFTADGWRKKILHIAGASDQNIQASLIQTLNTAGSVLSDTAFGGSVYTIAKNTTNPVDPFTNSFVDSMMNEGMGVLTFHGHAYATGFDYNINTPEIYRNAPKLPLFIALGCNVANIFDTVARTISERYVLSPNGGAVSMLAADLTQFTDFHYDYLLGLYSNLGKNYYGHTIGEQVMHNNVVLLQQNPSSRFRTNLEAMIYQGDPALRLYQPPKPDFHIQAAGIKTAPAQITTALDSFRLTVIAYNLAKGFRDTGLKLRINHINTAGENQLVRELTLPRLLFSDTFSFAIAIDKVKDLGLNRYVLSIDPDNRIAEMSETNNTVTYELFISGNNLIPVYPYPYSIVNRAPTLKASTLNPFAAEADYLLEIDTTETFNSPLLQQKRLSGRGGLVKWKPELAYQDSVVYYWRTAYATSSAIEPTWAGASFVYLPDAGMGWNQSHTYQYLPNSIQGLDYNASSRQFRFGRINKRVAVRCKTMYSDPDVENNKVQINEADVQRSSCRLTNTTMQIMVIDSATGDVWQNTPDRISTYGSANRCGNNRDVQAFEFILNDSVNRNLGRKFLDAIPAGKFVLIKSSKYAPAYNPADARTWLADTAAYGSGNTLYQRLKEMGFSTLDSFSGKRPFVFWTQKQTPGFVPYQQVGSTDTTTIVANFEVHPFDTLGSMQSIVVGPSEEWTSLHWQAAASDGIDSSDQNRVLVYGIRPNNTDTLLFRTNTRDTSLSGIDAATYPNLRLTWQSTDNIHRTAGQLQYWRIHYRPVPELALNPSAHLVFKDSTTIGEELSMSVALENLSDLPMDSVLMRYRVVQDQGSILPLQEIRYRPLAPEDTLHATLRFSSIPYGGANFLFMEANPDGDQPELYHPNNLGYLPFRVTQDVLNPLLDVTFDSIHISDRDLVSPRPEIRIRLTDDNRFRRLSDTSLIQVYLRSPGDPLSLFNGRQIAYDSVTCRFYPARYDSTGILRNEAYVIYRPTLTARSTSPDDNLYELVVHAKDPSGLASGSNDYRVSFRVAATNGITQPYNFPNPFVTKTRFAFLIAGDALPTDMRIEIVDLNGRLVRVIRKDELGPMRIGQNVSRYEWDGTDAGGVPLIDGIYLYRAVIEGPNGSMPIIPSEIDAQFKNGWGRMLLLRR
jgi:hypothetical protein